MKKTFAIIGIVLFAGLGFNLFTCKSSAQTNSQTNRQNENKTKVEANKVEANKKEKNPYEGLRNLALGITPEDIELKLPNDKTKVYGIVMDWDVEGASATFTAFQNGEASMYLSSGGGVIGGGFHENVRKAAVSLIDKAQNYLNKAAKTETTPLPEEGCVTFYFLTNKGKFVIRETWENLYNESSQWLELFEEANKLVSELRVLMEKEQKK